MGVVLAIALVSSSVARAESALRLPVPSEFARIPASTYDAEGRMLGDAQLVTERLENGHVRMAATTGIAGGPRTVASAELAPIDGESALRLLSERSQSYDFQGNALVLLEIDHRRGTARCTPHQVQHFAHRRTDGDDRASSGCATGSAGSDSRDQAG